MSRDQFTCEYRLKSKKTSKTEAVQSVTAHRLENENIHIGPSDYEPWQRDNKVCFIRMEGKLFGDEEMDLELRLSMEDSPNSAGVDIDAIRRANWPWSAVKAVYWRDRQLIFASIPPDSLTMIGPIRLPKSSLPSILKKFTKCRIIAGGKKKKPALMDGF